MTYHDLFWYPVFGNRRVQAALASDWGRLFHNWERLTPDASGFAELGEAPRAFVHGTPQLLAMGTRVLGTAIREAPEFSARLRRREHARSTAGR